MENEDKHKNLIEKSKKVYVQRSFDYLKQFSNHRYFNIQSSFPTIHRKKLRLKKGDRCFRFDLEGFTTVKNMVSYQEHGYGLGKSFNLESKKFGNFIVDKGVSRFRYPLESGSYGIKGGINSIFSPFFKSKESAYIRAIIPIQEDIDLSPSFYFDHEMYSRDENILSHGLVELTINELKLYLYSFKEEKITYLILESKEKTRFSEFEKIVDGCINSIALICGHLFRNEVFYLKSNSEIFNQIDGMKFSRLPDSVLSNKSIVAPRIAFPADIQNKINKRINRPTLTNLINLYLRETAIANTLKIITQSNALPKEIIASSYCVGLETLINFLNSKNEGSKPIKRPKVASRVIRDLKQIIEGADDSLFNSKEVVLRRITNINQKTNVDNYFTAFESIKYKLTDFDKYCLKQRDVFLHGKIPITQEDSNELDYIIFKLHYLICVLILKRAGYSGYLFNNITFRKILSKDMKIEEPLVLKI